MDFLLELLKCNQTPATNERCQEEGKRFFFHIFYFKVFNNCVADFCTAWLWQPGLFSTIIDEITDNFVENINIANVEISKLATLIEAVSIIHIIVALKLFLPGSLGTVQRIKIQQYKYLSMSQVKQREILNQNLLSRTFCYQERVFNSK